MSTIAIIRYQVRAEAAEENQRLVEKVYAELAAGEPGGLRYATFRLDDGVTFVHVALTEGAGDPLRTTSAFQEFQRGIGDRVVPGTLTRGEAALVGAYRFLGV
jgi:hypothetical protein